MALSAARRIPGGPWPPPALRSAARPSGTAGRCRPGPPPTPKTSARATHRAALDDRPAPEGKGGVEGQGPARARPGQGHHGPDQPGPGRFEGTDGGGVRGQVDRQLDGGLEGRRRHRQDGAGGGGELGGGAEVDGHGEGQALAVVGVVTDQVDPARADGSSDGWHRAERVPAPRGAGPGGPCQNRRMAMVSPDDQGRGPGGAVGPGTTTGGRRRPGPRRVVIVDDDELWRVKTAELLGARPDLVVAAAATHDVAAGWVDGGGRRRGHRRRR